MELTIEELHAVSHYFNQQPSLPAVVRELAVKMKEAVNPSPVAAKPMKAVATKKTTKK